MPSLPSFFYLPDGNALKIDLRMVGPLTLGWAEDNLVRLDDTQTFYALPAG